MVNGIDELAVTNIDGLDSVEAIKVCVAYRDGRKRYDFVPNDSEILARCEPIYEDYPGWKAPTHEARTWKELPPKTRSYLQAIAKLTGAKLAIASIGPGREQTIFVK
jgi:adenylosuccinate synthase